MLPPGEGNFDHPALDPEEQQFLARLDASYRPQPLAPTRRAELLAAVEGRARRSRLPKVLRPALAAGMAAAVLALWLGLSNTGEPPSPGFERETTLALLLTDSWEADVLIGDAADDNSWDEEAELPEDYLALAEIF